MRKFWDSAEQNWQVFIEDPDDRALNEFEFPDGAADWLREPRDFLDRISPVAAVSGPFFARASASLRCGEVHVVCWVKAGPSVWGDPTVMPPGFAHHGVLGQDWTDLSWIETGADPGYGSTLCYPLGFRDAGPVSWDAFPQATAEFRAAAEGISGCSLGSLDRAMMPVVRSRRGWSAPNYLEKRAEQGLKIPPELQDHGELLWIQRNYCGVDTLLLEPGVLVFTDVEGRVKIDRELAPELWLAMELEGGTRLQPSRVH